MSTVPCRPRRARELGLVRSGTPGPLNLVTDVPGVAVGLATLVRPDDGVRTGVTALLIAGIASWVVWGAVVSTIAAAMSGIFQTALYLYASTGVVPAGYSPVAIEAAFRPKSMSRLPGA